jgi:hypothetical protein
MTKKDLMKKHKMPTRNLTLPYQEGDIIDQVLTNLKAIIGGTKSSILRNALFSYNLFIKQSIKDLK